MSWTETARELATEHGGKGNDVATCPNCGAGADGYTCSTAGGTPATAVPSEGDAALCAYCGVLNIYRADQTLRPATDKEKGEYFPLIMEALRNARAESSEN